MKTISCTTCSCSVRKNAEDLKKSLEAVVIPIFCSTHIGAGADNQGKLKKVGTLNKQNDRSLIHY